jgi:hypothetical protein
MPLPFLRPKPAPRRPRWAEELEYRRGNTYQSLHARAVQKLQRLAAIGAAERARATLRALNEAQAHFARRR